MNDKLVKWWIASSLFEKIRKSEAEDGSAAEAVKARILCLVSLMEIPVNLLFVSEVLGIKPTTAADLAESLVKGGKLRKYAGADVTIPRKFFVGITPRGTEVVNSWMKRLQEQFDHLTYLSEDFINKQIKGEDGNG